MAHVHFRSPNLRGLMSCRRVAKPPNAARPLARVAEQPAPELLDLQLAKRAEQLVHVHRMKQEGRGRA